MIIMGDLVWYACYGSNINYERFKLYLLGGEKDFFGVVVSNEGCRDKSLPVRIKRYTFKHPVYFAKNSSIWGGGVAFLDTRKTWAAQGVAYLITYEQFLDVKRQEGSWYNEEIDLGELDGYPVKTFTGFHDCLNFPSLAYIKTINQGLNELD